MIKRSTKFSRQYTAVAMSLCLLGGGVLMPGAPAMAHLISGPVVGTFRNPVLTGNIIDGATGAPTFFNNTATAVFSGLTTNTFDWANGPFPLNHSTLVFVGSTVNNQASDQPFSLGTITFTNGTSNLDSLVFGVDLILSVLTDPSVTPLTSHINIVTTINSGTNAQNADFIGFNVFSATFNVFESATAIASLNGKFVGDPMIQLTGITLQPGQDPNGFIGAGLPQAVSEPGSFALLGLGLAFAAIVRRRSAVITILHPAAV